MTKVHITAKIKRQNTGTGRGTAAYGVWSGLYLTDSNENCGTHHGEISEIIMMSKEEMEMTFFYEYEPYEPKCTVSGLAKVYAGL